MTTTDRPRRLVETVPPPCWHPDVYEVYLDEVEAEFAGGAGHRKTLEAMYRRRWEEARHMPPEIQRWVKRLAREASDEFGFTKQSIEATR